MHTTKILDVAAINRATVPITNFPASGFACNQFKKETTSMITKTWQQPIQRNTRHLQVKELDRIPHLPPKISNKKLAIAHINMVL